MDDYKNILVHSLVNIGDVILATSAISLLRQVYPQAKVTMLVRPVAVELVVNNPIIDEVIVYDYKAKKGSMKSLFLMVKELRAKKFDLSISFDRKLRPALLTWFSGIPVRVGPDRVFDNKKSWVTQLYTHTIPIKHDLTRILQAETYQEIVRGFTGFLGKGSPAIGRIMPSNDQQAKLLLASVSVKPKQYRIGLCVKGTFPLKDWSKERFALLVDKISENYQADFFIIGAPSDKKDADEVIQLAKTPIANFCGQTNLIDLAAVLKRTDLFITVDTGATHIGATVGVPTVVMYGCTSPKRWRPINHKAVMISMEEPCCPCSKRATDCQEHMCMNKITVDQVFEKSAAILSMG